MSAHQFCTHPATKAARAKCRRESEKGLSGVRKPATTFEDRLARELAEYDENPGQMPTAAQIMPAEEPVEAIEVDNKEEYRRLCALIEDNRNAKKGKAVTRETWREFRDLDVEIEYEVWGSQPNHQLVGRLVTWGEKKLSYVSKVGKRNTIDVTRVLSVKAVADQD